MKLINGEVSLTRGARDRFYLLSCFSLFLFPPRSLVQYNIAWSSAICHGRARRALANIAYWLITDIVDGSEGVEPKSWLEWLAGHRPGWTGCYTRYGRGLFVISLEWSLMVLLGRGFVILFGGTIMARDDDNSLGWDVTVTVYRFGEQCG